MAQEQGITSEKEFTSMVVTDPTLSESSDSTYNIGYYLENVEDGPMFKEMVLRASGDRATAAHCLKIGDSGSHRNLMGIAAVDAHGVCDSEVLYQFAGLSTMEKAYNKGFFNKLPPEDIQSYMSDMLSGLNWLHVHNLYHGNLLLTSLFFMETGNNVGIIKLGLFKALPDDNHQERVSKDRKAFADLLHSFLMWSSTGDRAHEYEGLMLHKFIYQGVFQLYQTDFILRNPRFLTARDRPICFAEAVRRIIQMKVKIDDSILMKGKWRFTSGNPMRNYAMTDERHANYLWGRLSALKAIAMYRGEDGSLGLQLAETVKNLINHYKDNEEDYDLIAVIGRTPTEIEARFRFYQPYLFHNLYLMAQQAGYMYSGFQGVLPFDNGVLSRV